MSVPPAAVLALFLALAGPATGGAGDAPAERGRTAQAQRPAAAPQRPAPAAKGTAPAAKGAAPAARSTAPAAQRPGATGQRPTATPPGSAARERSTPAAQRRSAPRPPSAAARTLRAEQQRRLTEVASLENLRGRAREELERRRIDSALQGSEAELAAFLLSEEAVHRDRMARLQRLRELAMEAQDRTRFAAVDALERMERARHIEVMQSGSQRLSDSTRRELQARLAGVEAAPLVPDEDSARPAKRRKPNAGPSAGSESKPRARAAPSGARPAPAERAGKKRA